MDPSTVSFIFCPYLLNKINLKFLFIICDHKNLDLKIRTSLFQLIKVVLEILSRVWCYKSGYQALQVTID